MGKKKQLEKNILLSTKFTSYVENKPDVANKISSSSEYVVLSADDKELNVMNESIIESLVKQGKKVIKFKKQRTPRCLGSSHKSHSKNPRLINFW